MMDEVQEASNLQCNTPSSEYFITDLKFHCFDKLQELQTTCTSSSSLVSSPNWLWFPVTATSEPKTQASSISLRQVSMCEDAFRTKMCHSRFNIRSLYFVLYYISSLYNYGSYSVQCVVCTGCTRRNVLYCGIAILRSNYIDMIKHNYIRKWDCYVDNNARKMWPSCGATHYTF